MKKTSLILSFLFLTLCSLTAQTKVYRLSNMGILPNKSKSVSKKFIKALDKIKHESAKSDSVVILLEKGEYHFYDTESVKKEYYISNHDQTAFKYVGIDLTGMKNLTFDGNGADLIFHGRMLPIALTESNNCTLKNFSIDFHRPQMMQVEILSNDGSNGMTYKIDDNSNYKLNEKGQLVLFDKTWENVPITGMAFEPDTKRIVYTTRDLNIQTVGSKEISKGVFHSPKWRDSKLEKGHKIAMRTYFRPAPGIFLHKNNDTKLENIKVHFAEGMGLLAQLCTNIDLNGFCVSLKEGHNRYFTTQADATHFSSCKGTINSFNGLYENMMDDAINVHGTYLKIIKVVDKHTVIGQYMHHQAYGFDWGFVNDTVQFVQSNTMDKIGKVNKIVDIKPYDKSEVFGAKQYIIKLQNELSQEMNYIQSVGVENLTWTPKVNFCNNVVRNNRARGVLFSTPQRVVVRENLFDHTSGSAILLCGDCNGWFETGSCTEVIIENNKFVNALTSLFQFTNAVISIYPEIPNLAGQKGYFHGGKKGAIVIQNNEFHTFDAPILYAKSVNGIVFKNNKIIMNNDYKPYHWNKSRFLLERVTNAEID